MVNILFWQSSDQYVVLSFLNLISYRLLLFQGWRFPPQPFRLQVFETDVNLSLTTFDIILML